jgi:hypothetical protein
MTAAPLAPFSPVEEWRPVSGFEGIYEISSEGRIRGVRRRGSAGGLLTPSRHSAGYWQVTLSLCGIPTKRTLHSLVAEAFIGPCPPGQEVRHLDGQRENTLAVNLAYGTRSDNVQDAVSHGTHHLARRTHCDAGHEFTPTNTIIRESGHGRRCRTCRREQNQAAHERRKAAR